MRTTLTREYGGVNLDIIVDYDEEGISIEDVLHKDESILEILSDHVIESLELWVDDTLHKLLESDEYARADEKNDYRKD